MGDPMNELRVALGGAVPEGLDALAGEDTSRLATAIRDARARQARALTVAVDEGLRVVPLLMRGAIKKILFG